MKAEVDDGVMEAKGVCTKEFKKTKDMVIVPFAGHAGTLQMELSIIIPLILTTQHGYKTPSTSPFTIR